MGGSNADLRARADHEGADVKRGARAERRHPGGVGAHGFEHGFDELVFGEGGHFQALGRVGHTRGVHVGAERDDAAVLGGVGLQAFKAALRVVKHAGGFRKNDVGVGHKTAFVPGAVFPIGLITVIRGLIGKAEMSPVKRFLFHCDCLRGCIL